MMKIVLILAHPDRESFNHSIARAACDTLRESEHDVRIYDLYADKFPPLLTTEEIKENAPLPDIIEELSREIASVDGIVIVHPNWWGSPPAILKGLIDRCFRPGVAYRFLEGDSGEGVPVGLLQAQAAVIFNTSDTMPDREKSVFGDPLELIWKNCIFGLCGVEEVHREVFTVVVTSTAAQRKRWLERVEFLMNKYFPGKDDGGG